MTKGLILVGGKSSRMGLDKYLMDHHGLPQYQHLIDLFSGLGIPAFISCRQDQATMLEGTPLIIDRYDSIGPIGGIASAFLEDSKCAWLVVACDMPYIDEKAIQELLDQDDHHLEAISYQKQGENYLETTFSLYYPRIQPKMTEAIQNKEYSLQQLLRQCNVKALTPHQERVLHNLNTPGDMGKFGGKK